jgi:hypothetical protein
MTFALRKHLSDDYPQAIVPIVPTELRARITNHAPATLQVGSIIAVL